MKKICMLLVLALLLLTCGAPALAAEGDALLGHSEEDSAYFNYCFAWDGTLYLKSYSELYTYRLGDADLTAYTFEMPELPSDGNYELAVLPFISDGKLYAITLVSEYDEYTKFIGASLAELKLEGDSAVITTIQDLDWSDLVEEYEDNSYATQPEAVLGLPGKAVMRYYDNQGEGCMSVIDLKTGAIEQVEGLNSPFALTPYGENSLLVEEYSYEDGAMANLVVYDAANDTVEPLGEIKIDEYSPLQGLAYDQSVDTVYCVKGGEVCPVDIANGQVGEGLTDMPIDSAGASMNACMLSDGFYAYCADGAAIRNLDPAQKAQSRLKINDITWNESVNNTYYRFANAHGDVSVVLSRDYNENANLLDNMMNRDDSVDIYVMYCADSVYEALYNRGYLMELDGSEKLGALAERMYPSLRECLSFDGHLVALPVFLNGFSLGINETALNTLGLSMDDVPDNWPDFLDFLAGLEEPLKQHSGVHLFYAGYTVEAARTDLFNAIFDDYQHYVNLVDPTMGYDTELLHGLLEKLEQIDFTALGLEMGEESLDEEDDDFGYIDYSDEGVLLQTDVGCVIGNFYYDFSPLLMRMTPEADASIVLETAVAVINPFTKNPEGAIAFMEELADNLSKSTLYCMDPTQNEPYRGAWNEESIADLTQMVEEQRKALETAEAADKQAIEEDIRSMEESLAYYEENAWEISPREIEWYRAHDDHVVVAKLNWLYADESGEANDLIYQYQDGQIGIDEMLKGIDRKVQMMMLEGN